jgi:hypothetical protein
MSDQQIAELVRARNEGKSIELVDKSELEELRQGKDKNNDDEDGTRGGNSVSNDENIEELSNEELLRLSEDRVLKRVEGLLSEKLEPIQQKASEVDNLRQERQEEQLRTQVQQTRQKYEDFDEYKEDILKLSQKHTTLPVEDLYFLAKKNAGAFERADAPTDQEKPTHSTARGRRVTRDNEGREDRKLDAGNTRRSFQSMLNQVLAE